MVVEMLHTKARYVETHAQILRAQYALHVGNGCEVLGNKSAVEGVESLHAMILAIKVGSHKAYVVRNAVEQRPCEGIAEHGDAQFGILLGKRADYGNEHCHFAQGRETHYQEVFCLHRLLWF